MGSSTSKTARAVGSSARKYPNRPPAATTTRPPVTSTPDYPMNPPFGPTVHPTPQASAYKSEAVKQDAQDPAFASRLSSLGAVQPNPHYSPSSTSDLDPRRNASLSTSSDMMQAPPASTFLDPRNNPVIRVLEARQMITDEAEEELRNVGRKGFPGRKYVDAATIQLALMRQARGEPNDSIEHSLGIQKGRLRILGTGFVAAVHDA